MLGDLAKPKSPPVPPSLMVGCARPQALPEDGLSDQGVEVLWGRDRDALVACYEKHKGLAMWPR